MDTFNEFKTSNIILTSNKKSFYIKQNLIVKLTILF